MRSYVAVAAAAAAWAAGVACQAATPDPWREIWGWGDDPLRVEYEQLFDAPFPARPYDVFHRSHPFYEVQQFNHAFDLRAAGVSYRVEEARDGVTLLVTWPGSGERAVDVSVNDGYVRLKPSALPSSSSPYRFRAAHAEDLLVPVPPSAKPESAKVAREGETVRVTFAKR